MPSMSEMLEAMRAKKAGVSNSSSLAGDRTVIQDKPEYILNSSSRSEGGHESHRMDIVHPYQETMDDEELMDELRQEMVDEKEDEEQSSSSSIHQLPNSNLATVEVIDEDALIEVATEIILNTKQMEAHSLALSGKSFCLIGAAGTGKTTSMKKITRDLIDAGHIPLSTESTRHLRVGSPGIAVISFTNKAVNNIRRSVDSRIKLHTLTAHKLLEFRPIKYEIEDEKNGGTKTTMKFEPARNRDNPLPAGLKLIIWEESSMLGTQLYNMVREALPHDIQEIFLGDIQQLPPVFGSAVLGFKMNELPVIELTEVYRQALESPIIKLAWKILAGNPHDFSARVIRTKHPDTGKPWITCPALDAMNYNDPIHGSLEFRIWQKVTTETQALMATQMMFKNWYTEGKYNPYKDIILCPYNPKYGTIEINKLLAQYFSIQRNEAVHEIIAGYEKVYYAVGDRVLVGKEDAFIESIEPNPAYLGKTTYCIPSVYLDRWGVQQAAATSDELLQHKIEQDSKDEGQADYFLEGEGSIDDIDGDSRVNAASHIVTCRFSYSDEVVVLKTASELKPPAFLGGYCLTVHKFQGSEEEKVFILLHQMHSKMVRRELLYTAVTRARKHLVIVCENSSFEKGVAKQSIKGDTIAEKAEVFKGKLEDIKNDDEIPTLSTDLQLDKVEVSGNDLSEMPQPEVELENKNMDTPKRISSEMAVAVNKVLTPMEQKLADMKAKLAKMKGG